MVYSSCLKLFLVISITTLLRLVTSIGYFQCSDVFLSQELEMILSCKEFCQCAVKINHQIVEGCKKTCCCREHDLKSYDLALPSNQTKP